MYKLISKEFKKTDIELFISYHRWEISKEHRDMFFELSKKGEIANSNKDELQYIRNKVEYGGFEAYLINEDVDTSEEGTKWICQSCSYSWIEEEVFATWDECPKCQSDYVQHE